MLWRKYTKAIEIGGEPLPIKTIYLFREGVRKRTRVSTLFSLFSPRWSRWEAWAWLARDQEGRIGALLTGIQKNFLRVGEEVHPWLLLSLDALGKRDRKRLLLPLNYELVEEEGSVLARELEEEPYWVASKTSPLFHWPGCPWAKRISPQKLIYFRTRLEAKEKGYSPHSLCRA